MLGIMLSPIRNQVLLLRRSRYKCLAANAGCQQCTPPTVSLAPRELTWHHVHLIWPLLTLQSNWPLYSGVPFAEDACHEALQPAQRPLAVGGQQRVCLLQVTPAHGHAQVTAALSSAGQRGLRDNWVLIMVVIYLQ